MAVLTLLYTGLLCWFGVLAMRSSSPVGVVLGIAMMAFGVAGTVAVVAEVRFGVRASKLADRLLTEQRGVVEVTSPADGRRRADEAVPELERDASAEGAGWREAMTLALALDAAGNRRAARRAAIVALRRARKIVD